MSDRYALNKNLAQMLKGGVIMDVTTPEQAKIAEAAGACAVMALERIPADIRAAGGVSRMSDPKMIKAIQQAVSIPVMAKVRIGHFVEAQVLEAKSTSASHTISYSFGGASGQIASGVGDSVVWTPPISLAAQIPSATSGLCTITCETYYSGVLIGTKTCTLTLNVPASVVPTISSVNYSEAVAGIPAQFAGYVQNKSKLAVSIAASGAQGSTITAYRATLGGSTYTASSFTTGLLSIAGNNTLTVTVTDSRGQTATTTRTISVLAYAPPTLSLFKAERCNATGTAPQTDGNRVRISATAGASSAGGKNTMGCTVFYKLSSAPTWTQSTTIAPSNYAIAYVDGPAHTGSFQREEDQRIDDRLLNGGIMVLRFREGENWGEIATKHPSLFGTAANGGILA